MSAKILIVDDQPSTHQTLENQLYPEGYTLQFALNAAEGLARAQAWQPDVILADVMLPGADGFEFCRKIRADAELGSVPIILFTALNDRQVKLSGLQAGADDFISKPIDTLELRARLRTLTRLDRFRKLNDDRLRLEVTHRELLLTHEALRASAEQYRQLVEQSPDAILIECEGEIVYLNPAGVAMAGAQQAETLLGKPALNFIHPHQRENVDALIHAALEKGHSSPRLEATFLQLDGTELLVEATALAITYLGKPARQVIFRDLTAHKRLAEARRESEERYHLLFETLAQGVVFQDQTGKIIQANPAAERILGLTLAQMQGRTSIDPRWHAIHADGSAFPGDTHPAMVALRTGQSVHEVVMGVFSPASNAYHWIMINAVPRFLAGETKPYQVYTTFEDITDRKQAEVSLKESEERFRAIFEQAAVGVAQIASKTGEFIRVNQTYCEIVGYTRAEMLKTNFRQITHPEDLQADLDQMQLMLEGKIRSYTLVKRYCHKTGSIVWVELTVSPLWKIGAEPDDHIAVVKDITKRKQAEEALQKSEAFLSEALRVGNIGYWEWTPPGNSLICSDELLEIFEMPKAQKVISQSAIELLILPQDRERLRQLDWQALANHTDLEYEFRIQLPSGRLRWVFQRVQVTYTPEGQPARMLGILQDITASKQADEKLRDSQVHIEMALKGANAATWDWNVQTGETVFNERWAEIVGYSLRELEPVNIQTWIDLCHPEDLQRSDELLHKHFAGETEFYECEARMKHKNGSWVWVIDRGKVMKWDAEGKPLRMFGTHLDITERKREESYTQARLRLANLSYEKLDLDSLMRTMLDEAEALTDSQIGFFHFVDHDQNTISLQAWSTNTLETLCTAEGKGQHYPVATAGVWADGIRDGEPRLYNDYASLPNRRGLPPGHAPVTRFVSVPIKRDNLIVAAIGVGNKAQDYTQRDREIVARLAEEAFDIVLRKRAEQALRSSEEKYRGLMESLDSVIAATDANGLILYINDVAAQGLGGKAEEFIGKTMDEIFPPEYAQAQLAIIRQVIHENHAIVSETPNFIHGKLHWYRISYQPIHTETGEVSHVLVNATDINHLKTIQQELQDLNRTLEEKVNERTAEVLDLYDNAPAGYHSLDTSGKFVMVNQTELNWLGYLREELLGQPFADFLVESSRQIFADYFPTLKQQGFIRDIELELVRKDGSRLPVLLNASAQLDENGQFFISRATILDNSERKRAAETLRQSRDELNFAYLALEKASHAKDEFLANMSHELRTPLNNILGLSEILMREVRGPLNEAQQKYVQNIEISGRHLLSLISDILDLSKIESGKFEIYLEKIILDDICNSSLAFVKEPALKKGLSVSFVPDPTVTEILADARRLKQILVNLLSNAIKFTPANGEVVLKVEARLAENWIDLSVSDTGIGISPENLERLFNPFIQVDSSLTRQYEGTGLGLVLVKNLTELQGGQVRVTSTVGQGSCFTISLPWLPEASTWEVPASASAELAPDEAASHLPEAVGEPVTILLADDVESNLITVADYLEALGYRLVIARNGIEALQKAAACLPQLILMDIQMPEMDGLEAIRRLRKQPLFAQTPIIALTALAMTGDRERCLAAGANEYLSKPMRLKELVALMQGLLKR